MRILAIAAALSFAPGVAVPAFAQSQPREIPPQITGTVRAELETEKMRILAEQTAISDQASAHNERCHEVRLGGPEDTRCLAELERLNGRIRKYEQRVANFDTAVGKAEAAAAGRDAVANEQAEMDADPEKWTERQWENVRDKVNARSAWRREALRFIEESSSGKMQITKFSELTPGDVLLIVPAHIQNDVAGAAVGGAVLGGDYLIRVTSDFATGKIFRAVDEKVTPAAHVVTFVRATGDKMLFLDHTLVGSRILDQRQFLRSYGSRPMFVARPEAVVDGREIWNAARQAALQKKSDYGLFGKNVVCSERAGIAVARATGLPISNGRIGPVDITPGDFFDRRGDVGKHFVVTQLRITPTINR